MTPPLAAFTSTRKERGKLEMKEREKILQMKEENLTSTCKFWC